MADGNDIASFLAAFSASLFKLNGGQFSFMKPEDFKSTM